MFTSRGSMVDKVGWAQLLGEKSRWHSSLGASNVIMMGSRNFWKIPAHLRIWVYEYLGYKYLSKSLDKIVMMGRSVPCCSVLRSYTCCPILVTDWSLSRMMIPSTLLYKTYISIRHCSVPLPLLDCINVTLGYPKSTFSHYFGIMDLNNVYYIVCLVIICLYFQNFSCWNCLPDLL